MLEQSDHFARDLSLAAIAHKENWLAVGKFYKKNCKKSLTIVKIVQSTDSLPLHGKKSDAPI
ncbi:hypothetical protein HUO14_04350 [Parasphingorhabdus flavimaris]|jgi:hypothetical protein|uniref:Uncharacterized protein n=1 Tax=Parasphingorhabdus flavimaris TaxID=266812 RepID=A0ABX2N0J1_9SPHN|nr:hypothetical protein [Parasphingorhabdus flavimaris]NVD27141.1 hypothetical protein [Parasphingorhabdus flavimaris]|tara:strand:- start:10667 stop:10852 length:186 start_codon:yes stop_codon:yes gene_type:complete